MCSKAGIKTVQEPTNCFPEHIDGIKPDMRLYQPQFQRNKKRKTSVNCTDCKHDVITDVTVTHPANKSAIDAHKSHRVPGASALDKEKNKCRKYNAAAKNHKLHFVPLVLESYGRLGGRFVRFLKDVVHTSWHNGDQTIPLSVLQEYWNKRISVALQQMNARMFLNRVSELHGGASLRNDEARYDDTIRESIVRSAYGRRG
jgi:hypothetical protein